MNLKGDNMNPTISDLALDLGVFALDNEMEDGTASVRDEQCSVAA